MKKIFLIVLLIHVPFFLGKANALEGGYKDGFYLQSDDGDYKLKFNFLLQPQFQFLSVEGQGKTSSFQIRRFRLYFSGHAFTERLTYKFVLEGVGGRVSNTSESVAFTGPNLRDAYVNYDFENGVEIQVGQFKPYYNREELTSSTKLQFVDRSLTNEVFSFNRDLGLALHGKPWEKKIEYALYVANEGSNQNTANNNNEFLFGGRLVWNILGEHGYTLGDTEHSEEPQLALGLASTFNRVGAPTTPDASVIASTGDVAFRYKGFQFLGEGHYMRNQTASTNTLGFLGQAGYFIVPKKFEVATRFAGVIPTASGVTNGYEAGVSLNYLFKGHRLKIQTDYNLLINSSLVLGVAGAAGVNGPANIVTTGGAPGFIQNQNDHRLRTQLQIFF